MRTHGTLHSKDQILQCNEEKTCGFRRWGGLFKSMHYLSDTGTGKEINFCQSNAIEFNCLICKFSVILNRYNNGSCSKPWDFHLVDTKSFGIEKSVSHIEKVTTLNNGITLSPGRKRRGVIGMLDVHVPCVYRKSLEMGWNGWRSAEVPAKYDNTSHTSSILK